MLGYFKIIAYAGDLKMAVFIIGLAIILVQMGVVN